MELLYMSLVSLLILQSSPAHSATLQYTAAVYEHTAFFIPLLTPTRKEALRIMMVNLEVYKLKASEASSRGGQIIVFPEDGIYGMGYKREQIAPFLEEIPDPKELQKSWNPCREPNRFKETEVLCELSCIAMNYSIAVVANMGDTQPCATSDPHCPTDKHFQFNTDVIFDTDGTFLAKYHKQHLFHEDAFNTPAKCEYVTFMTSFGVTFGVFTCFDMLFEKPAMELVRNYSVRNVVFPTAWMKGFPILYSVQYQQAWSRTTCVNLLAANQNHPLFGMWGSGIYACGEPKAYVFNPRITAKERLLVATLQLDDGSPYALQYSGKPVQEIRNGTVDGGAISGRNLKRARFGVMPDGEIFQAKVMGDMYSLVKLESTEGKTTICNNGLCCDLEYQLKGGFESEFYALGAFRGGHDPEGFFLEVCVFFKCANTQAQSCGVPVDKASTVFQSFRLSGNFTSTIVAFPELLGSGPELFGFDAMTLSGHYTMESRGLTQPLLAAVLLGRDYSKDPK